MKRHLHAGCRSVVLALRRGLVRVAGGHDYLKHPLTELDVAYLREACVTSRVSVPRRLRAMLLGAVLAACSSPDLPGLIIAEPPGPDQIEPGEPGELIDLSCSTRELCYTGANAVCERHLVVCYWDATRDPEPPPHCLVDERLRTLHLVVQCL